LAEDFADFPPSRPAAGHKGTFGHACILAGSVGYHGAAVLAARGAQRAQPGLVTLITLPSAYVPVASQLQAVMVRPWTQDTRRPDATTAMLLGPGLASPDIPSAFKEYLTGQWREAPFPVIVDASALEWLPPGPIAASAPRVITPHPGEAARLLTSETTTIQADRPAAVHALSERYGSCWVVLKGHQTVVGRKDGPVFVNSTGNPFLAQGGSGDVLAGYLAGLIAQPLLQLDLLTALRYGVWRHGGAADQLSAQKPNWCIEDLVEALGAGWLSPAGRA